jgi:hypothetical protein
VNRGTDYDLRVSGITLVGYGLMQLFESDLFRAFLGLGWAKGENESAKTRKKRADKVGCSVLGRSGCFGRV